MEKALEVLIVDDEEKYHTDHEQLLQNILGKETRFHHKYDGEKGSMYYEDHPDIDLIITDNQMKECDGLWLVKLVRAWEKRTGKSTHVPIIMITGRLSHPSVQEAKDAGLNIALEKDVSEVELRRALEEVLLHPR